MNKNTRKTGRKIHRKIRGGKSMLNITPRVYDDYFNEWTRAPHIDFRNVSLICQNEAKSKCPNHNSNDLDSYVDNCIENAILDGCERPNWNPEFEREKLEWAQELEWAEELEWAVKFVKDKLKNIEEKFSNNVKRKIIAEEATKVGGIWNWIWQKLGRGGIVKRKMKTLSKKGNKKRKPRSKRRKTRR